MEDVIALEDPDDFAFIEAGDTDTAVFVGLANLHLLDFVQVQSQPHDLFLQAFLLQLERDRILQHQLMELLGTHPMNGGVFGRILPIVVGLCDVLPLILPVDEVEVVLSVGVVFYGTVCHLFILCKKCIFLLSLLSAKY